MNPLVILGLLIGIPIALGLLLRVSAMLVFLSLVVGQLFVQFLADDVEFAIRAFVKGDAYSALVLLLAPVAITLLVARKSVPASKLLINIPFLIMTGLTVAVLAIPLLPNHIEAQIYTTKTGNALRQTQDDIIGITGLLNLAFVWFTYRSKSHGHHGKRH